jgi:lipoate---protein ligase
MKWKIIDTGSADPGSNMAADAALLQSLEAESVGILHLYDWSAPSATYGHFADFEALIDLQAARAHGLQTARRPTGGGLLFHLTDFAFSVLVPSTHPMHSMNTMDNYAAVNHIVENIMHDCFHCHTALLSKESAAIGDARYFCMAKPTKYDVMAGGKKIAGAAQRQTRHGFLHQGTIHLTLPPEQIVRDVLKDNSVFEAMRLHSFSFVEPEEVPAARRMIKERFITYFSEGFN